MRKVSFDNNIDHGLDRSHLVDCLPSMHGALTLIPNTAYNFVWWHIFTIRDMGTGGSQL